MRCIVKKSLLKGVEYEEMDKKIPVRSTWDTNNRYNPNPCSSNH